VLEYVCGVWIHNSAVSQYDKLDSIQKRALCRIINGDVSFEINVLQFSALPLSIGPPL